MKMRVQHDNSYELIMNGGKKEGRMKQIDLFLQK